MIKIWEYSEQVHHNLPLDSSSCNCAAYLNMCIDAVTETWDRENYIYLDTVIYHFQFHRKKYVVIMAITNLNYREFLVNSIIIRRER